MKNSKKQKDPFLWKDRVKIVRGCIQALVLLVLLGITLRALFVTKKYEPFQEDDVVMSENGFIALSYFGTDRTGTDTLIGVERLKEHFEGLAMNGYVTITQKDIENYYRNNEKLPEKSLFLMVEDGRSETAIFAQDIMEDLNYAATMCSYAGNIDSKDNKFLDAKDLKKLVSSGWWELGTNGNQLKFINVRDLEGNYLGVLSAIEFSHSKKKLGTDYNHFLMDYIRDEYNIPMETYSELEKRIGNEYEALREKYLAGIGYVPGLHVLMHANTGAYGTNTNVSELNKLWITSEFNMNFNREGNSLNDKNNSIYDLTRIQPQAYWYTNHLLMRIQEDTKEEMVFVLGKGKNQNRWSQIHGAVEFQDERIILTSEAGGLGQLFLSDETEVKDVKLKVTLTGNKLGNQAIYLRADSMLNNYLKVSVNNDTLVVVERVNGEDNEIFIKELTKIEGDGEREDQVSLSDPGKYEVEIKAQGDKLDIMINDDTIVKNLTMNQIQSGRIALESSCGDYENGYSQKKLYDNVYDGVFEELEIYDISKNTEALVYSDILTGFNRVWNKIDTFWNKVINWFIRNL